MFTFDEFILILKLLILCRIAAQVSRLFTVVITEPLHRLGVHDNVRLRVIAVALPAHYVFSVSIAHANKIRFTADWWMTNARSSVSMAFRETYVAICAIFPLTFVALDPLRPSDA